jgi:hypothetical protein
MKTILTIEFDEETEMFKIDIEGDNGYKNILGMIEHAKMQLFCDYNKDIFEPKEDDESLFQ